MHTFTKLQGLGNDFILFDNIGFSADHQNVTSPQMAVALCDRRFGIGADGLFVLRVAKDQVQADLSWEFYNADGSMAEMCGNAIRCVGRYIFDKGLWPLSEDAERKRGSKDGRSDASDVQQYEELRIETLAGIKAIGLELDDEGAPTGFRVDMGIAELDSNVEIEGRSYSRVSMGNPHAVTFVDDLLPEFGSAPVATEGPLVEIDPVFPNKTNVEFARVENRELIHMRVWERGVGETLACATGACATAVVAKQKDLADDKVTVMLAGGPLKIEITKDLRVHMTGPAELVYTGIIMRSIF